LTVIVDNYDARRRRGYNGDLSVVEQRASRSLLMAMLCSFQGPARAATGDSPAGLSKLSSTRRHSEERQPTRLGRRSRCASQARRPGGRLALRAP
jgi:hypothetical protein